MKRGIHTKIRLILFANVLLLVALFGAYSLNPVYARLKAASMEDALASVVFMVIFASTTVAIVLFIGEIIGKLKGRSSPNPEGSTIALDGVLLILWSVAFGGLCIYAFVLGMAAF
jgi:hypothetical protein